MKENKGYLVTHIGSTWYWYLLASVLVVVFWSFVFGLLDRIPYHEQINMFVAGYEIQKEQMEEQISEILKGSSIRQVTVDACTPGREEAFHMVLATRGTVNTDILILPEGTWPEEMLQGKVLGFTEQELASYLPEGEYQYIERESIRYGICVYDADKGKSLLPKGWIAFEADVEQRDYYLFFSIEADNVGRLGMDYKNKDDQALKLIGTLIRKAEELQ